MQHHDRRRARGFLAVAAMSLIATAVLTPQASGFAGTWTASFDSQVGVQTYTYTFQVEGNKLTGRAKSAHGDYEIANGNVMGDHNSFVEYNVYHGIELAIAS